MSKPVKYGLNKAYTPNNRSDLRRKKKVNRNRETKNLVPVALRKEAKEP